MRTLQESLLSNVSVKASSDVTDTEEYFIEQLREFRASNETLQYRLKCEDLYKVLEYLSKLRTEPTETHIEHAVKIFLNRRNSEVLECDYVVIPRLWRLLQEAGSFLIRIGLYCVGDNPSPVANDNLDDFFERNPRIKTQVLRDNFLYVDKKVSPTLLKFLSEAYKSHIQTKEYKILKNAVGRIYYFSTICSFNYSFIGVVPSNISSETQKKLKLVLKILLES